MSDLPHNPHDQNDLPAMDEVDVDLSDTEVPSEPEYVVQQGASMDDLAAATEQAASAASPEPADDGESEGTDIWAEFEGDNPHVTLKNPVYRRQKIDPLKPSLSALKVGAAELEKILIQRDLVDLTEDKIKTLSAEDRRLVTLARTLAPIWQDLYFDGIDNEGDWHQGLDHGEVSLSAGKVRPENLKDPVLAIRASFGQGSVVQVPLWNTGLWISFRAPSLQALADFEMATRAEKMNLGRSSNGMVYSNTEVYTVETYMRFALEHVVAVNYTFETSDTVNELLSVIRSRDYQQVIWGLIMAMYPDGYSFRQPCVAETDGCTHVDEMILNFARMGVVDRSKFTEKQRRMMASRKTKRDRNWLQEYQNEFTFAEKRVKLNDSFTAVLRVPSLADQIAAGHIWTDGIIQATNSAFGQRLAELERMRHVMRSGVLTGLRQYAHWVSHFEHSTDPDSEPRIIDSIENKDRVLDLLSEDPDLSGKLNDEIIEWFQKSTVSYVGLPKIKCPSCQKPAKDETHPHLIPLDVGYVFFTLAAFKISQVENAAG